jgi:HD-GYP domain-containing protein (c-di-GMP phosphodiesterase class II)
LDAKDVPVLLREIVRKSKNHVDACIKEDVGIICFNRKLQKKKTMPFRILHENNSQFWLKNESWEYFVAQEDLAKIEERAIQLNQEWTPGTEAAAAETPSPVKPLPQTPAAEIPVAETPAAVKPLPQTVNTADISNAPAAPNNGFGEGFVAFAGLSELERLKRMQDCKKRLEALIAQKPRQEDVVTKVLVEATEDTILHNYTSLISAMNLAESDAKQQTQNIVDSTHDIVVASSQLIAENILNDELMSTLVSKSNGTIIQHMTRTYLKGLSFLSFYNKLVSGSSLIQKLRISFGRKYHAYYRYLLPHIDPEAITLERVFLGGMRAIPEDVFYNWAVGFLVHDIGKASTVEYHEGEGAYNRDIVMEHVKVGYNAIMNKTNYPEDAGLIAGFHHEYYGDPSGYGFFRLGLEQYKKRNPQVKQDYCIAYEVKPMRLYQALAFFPAKLLEIVDVFDSLTDPNRKYRKALTTEEALDLIEEEFINKGHKVDPILFDLFTRFISEI